MQPVRCIKTRTTGLDVPASDRWLYRAVQLHAESIILTYNHWYKMFAVKWFAEEFTSSSESSATLVNAEQYCEAKCQRGQKGGRARRLHSTNSHSALSLLEPSEHSDAAYSKQMHLSTWERKTNHLRKLRIPGAYDSLIKNTREIGNRLHRKRCRQAKDPDTEIS